MLTSSDRKDWILRMIQEIAQMVARLIGRKLEGDLDGALREGDTAIGRLLGPMAGVAPRVDSVTAAHMVAEPEVIAAWARVVHEQADVWRLKGEAETAAVLERRALELALEAHLREDRTPPELLSLVSELRPLVPPETLAERHRDALETLPAE